MSIHRMMNKAGSADGLAARLRHRVTIQQPQETADGLGGVSISWQDVAEVWAQIVPLNGGESMFAFQQQAQVSHRITIRYRADVDASMRIVFEGRAFNIRSVVNVQEAKVMLELLAQEGVAL